MFKLIPFFFKAGEQVNRLGKISRPLPAAVSANLVDSPQVRSSKHVMRKKRHKSLKHKLIDAFTTDKPETSTKMHPYTNYTSIIACIFSFSKVLSLVVRRRRSYKLPRQTKHVLSCERRGPLARAS